MPNLKLQRNTVSEIMAMTNLREMEFEFSFKQSIKTFRSRLIDDASRICKGYLITYFSWNDFVPNILNVTISHTQTTI